MHSLIEAIPFVGIILSIAILPVVAHDFWHKHVRKVLLAWILLYCGIEIKQFGCEPMLTGTFNSIVNQGLLYNGDV